MDRRLAPSHIAKATIKTSIPARRCSHGDKTNLIVKHMLKKNISFTITRTHRAGNWWFGMTMLCVIHWMMRTGILMTTRTMTGTNPMVYQLVIVLVRKRIWRRTGSIFNNFSINIGSFWYGIASCYRAGFGRRPQTSYVSLDALI